MYGRMVKMRTGHNSNMEMESHTLGKPDLRGRKITIFIYKDHEWMYGRSGRREYCIGPGSSIILFVHPFPQYLIKVGYGCGWVGAVE